MKNSALAGVFAFLKLIRVQNLVMIALTQVLLRYCVLQKIFSNHQIEPGLDHFLFFLMVLSTVMIAAGGYVINDYFDVKTDMINHPDSVVVDRSIKRRWAIVLHLVLTIGGVVLGVYTALVTGYLRLAFFHIAAATLLWFYSTHLKRRLLIGNITVALLTAAVTFMPFIYEMGFLQKVNPGFVFTYKSAVFTSIKYAWIYASFAFITTMAREIIKDLEDYEGDEATGCKTMPIVWGINSARITAFFLLIITVILLSFVVYNTIRWQNYIFSLSVVYIVLLLILPLLFLAFYVFLSARPRQYKRGSMVLKIIMLAGLSYSLVFYYS